MAVIRLKDNRESSVQRLRSGLREQGPRMQRQGEGESKSQSNSNTRQQKSKHKDSNLAGVARILLLRVRDS